MNSRLLLMRRLLDAFITAAVMILFIPTFLILLSWNAIPGDSLYPLKTGLEDITLLLLSGTPLVPKVSMKFTDRRFDEATKLLDKKGSTVGYDLLVSEAQQTQTLITSKNDRIDTAAFVQNIDQYQQKIEQTKVQVQTKAGISVIQQTPAFISSPTPIPVVVPTQGLVPGQTSQSVTGQPVSQEIIVTKPEKVVIKEETPQQVLQKLNDTEAQLEEIKKKVQKDELQGENGDHGQGQGQNQDQGNQNSNDHKPSSNNP